MRVEKTDVPHVEWLELHGDGLMHECAIMKRDAQGNTHFIEVGKLDRIDKSRLSRILGNRNASSMELWNLMSDITLNNGVNALTYFHQLVRVVSANGTIYNPRSGVVGTSVRNMDGTNHDSNAAQVAEADKPVKKGPFGRPLKE